MNHFRKFINCCLVIGIWLLTFAQIGTAAERVLSIGNSLINRNDTPGMFNLMAAEAGKGLRWTEQYWSGRSLAQHFSVSETQVTSAKYVVSHTAWDYIILQEFSSTPLIDLAEYRQSVQNWRDYIRANCPNPQVQIILFQNWAYDTSSNYAGDSVGLQTNTLSVAQLSGVDAWTIPSGRAFNVVNTTDGVSARHNLYADYRHPSVLGSYLSACVAYSCFFRSSPVGLAYRPSGLSAAQAAQMQTRAWVAAGGTIPTIATNPTSTTNGLSAQLRVTGADDNGQSQLYYTWETVGTAPGSVTFSMNGTNSASIATATFSAAGVYNLRVRIMDCGGLSVVSENISMTASGGVTTPVSPTITTQPTNQTVVLGSTATFNVIATGTPSPSYQWQKNGVNITGATASTYTTTATVIGDHGQIFRCVVSNSAGTRNSSNVTLTVTSGTPPVTPPSPILSGSNSARPILSGTAEVGATVHILDNNSEVGTVVVGLSGNWSWTPSVDLLPGTHPLTVVVQNAFGSSVPSAVVSVTVTPVIPPSGGVSSEEGGGGSGGGCGLGSTSTLMILLFFAAFRCLYLNGSQKSDPFIQD